MKTIRKFHLGVSQFLMSLVATASLVGCDPAKSHAHEPVERDQRIMLALLLDTSNSMDGLINQAKSQLWKIVNELSAAKCSDGSRPDIQIALYEYGNDGLSSSEGYIRLVSPFTTDLDLISEKLFSLTTNGGSEYCGQVINKSLNQLLWSTATTDLKMIFIAGNEPFTQGEVPYATACALARQKGVIVNTIHCGTFEEGIRTDWKRGAELTNGSYMSIEQDRKTVYIETPYDKQIDALNGKLNETYIYYGKAGEGKKEMQRAQDQNAESYGLSNKVDRAVSKSSHAYKNSSWDLVDAAKDDTRAVEKAEDEYLPAEMQVMSVEQRKAYVKQKSDERQRIQNEIQALNAKRSKYIEAHTPQGAEENMLDAAMLKAIREKANVVNLKW